MDMSNYEEKGEQVEPHGVPEISISAKTGSNISAPVILNSTVGNIIISKNYFPGVGPAAEITDTSSLITEYKKSLLSEYAYITEYTSRAGEQVLLNDRYINPLIVQKHREKKERENEMRSRGERFFSARESNQRNQNINLDELFVPEDGSKKVTPRAVILQGDSGSGKSITAQKIVLDWASGELYASLFDVVFHLRCKELSGLSGEMSLVDLLDCSLTPDEIGQILKDIPQKILFIIDGYDELMLSASKEALPQKPVIKSHPLAIVCSLLKGRMLRESILLVTTRSNAVDHLENILKKPQCFMEIMGFSEKGVSEYFQRFFEDEEFSSQVYEQVKRHEMLYTACFIPAICWIICTIFKRKGKDGVVPSELTTTTSISVDFVLTLLKHHSSQDEKLDLLKNLGQLAESGMLKRQVLFPRNKLPKAISDITNIPFLCTFRQQERTCLKEMFGFRHLSFQEFFTALFYVLTDKADAEIKIKELLESAGNGRCNEYLFPVIRFLFGLSNKEVSRLILGESPRSTSSVIRAQLEKWITKVIQKNPMDTWYMSDFILHCLYELHDEDIVKKVMKLWERLGITIHWSLKGIDCQVVMYCLQYSSRIINMEVKCNAKDLKMLSPALYRCTTLWLDFDSISDTDVNLLTAALGKGKNVPCLSMEDGALSDESMQKILKTLSGQTSVGNIRLVLRSISNANVDLTMNFLVKEMMGKSFSVCIASQAENIHKSLCSEFTMASQHNSVWFTVGHSEGHQGEISEKLCYYQGFSKISFALCPFSAIPMTEFLKASHNLRCFSELKNIEFGVNVDALLSFLSCVPGLVELDLRAEYLTDIWTSRILRYLQVNSKISHIKFHVSNLMISDDERVFSTFSVFRKPYEAYKIKVESERKNPSLTLAMDRWAHDIAYGNSGEPAHSYCLDKPALVKLTLSFPPLEGCSVIWEVLFQRLYKVIQLTEQCPELDEHTDSLLLFLRSVPGLKEVKVWLNNLIESWAAGLFTLFLSCSSLLHLQLNTSMSLVSDVESLGVMRKDGVRLSVGCNHLNYIDDCCDVIDFFKPPEHKMVPCITIAVTDDSENANVDWRRFFQAYNQLKNLTECSSEYDESVSDLLSVLHSVSGLKEVDLTLRFMTVDGASRVLDLIQMNPSLSSLNFLAVKQPERSKANFKKDCRNEFSSIHRTSESEEDSDSDRSNDFWCQSARQMSDDSDEDSDQLDNVERILCLDIRMWKTLFGQCSLILKCTGSSPSTQPLLSQIELTLSENSGETSSDWKTFLRAYIRCKGISTRSPAFDESVDALLLSLRSVSGLEKVQLKTDSLTENWAPKILSLCHTCPSLHNIGLQVEYDKRYSVLNGCSSLSITKNITDSTWTVGIRLVRDSMNEISPSFISFTSPCSEIPKLDGQELFETLDLLKGSNESCLGHEELVGILMSSLLSVPGLRRIKLEISSLTENWVRRILFLAEVCPSLQEIRYDCIGSGGLLLEDVVRILQSSQMDSDCRIIITGMKRSKTTDWPVMMDTSRSSAACDEKVKVTFCRDSLTRLFTIDNIETEDFNGDDFEDLDDEDFIVM